MGVIFPLFQIVLAKLLDPTGLVRFVPNTEHTGTETFDFRLWDQTTGTHGTLENVSTNGGATAFGSDVLTADLDVTAVNDAPRFVGGHEDVMSFDGVDDTITMPDAAVNNMASGTISAWINIADLANVGASGAYGSGQGGNAISSTQLDFTNTGAFFGVGLNDGSNLLGNPDQLVFQSQNGQVAYSDTSLATVSENEWAHVTVTFDASGASFYINGVHAGTTAGTFIVPSLGAGVVPSIGGLEEQGSLKYSFNGLMDEYTVYDTKLNATQAEALYEDGPDASDPNLRVYYEFDGGNATDSSTASTDYSGTLNGAVATQIIADIDDEPTSTQAFTSIDTQQIVSHADGSYAVFLGWAKNG